MTPPQTGTTRAGADGPTPRLSGAAWPALARAGHCVHYERRGLATGIVHLGAGAFFRAHSALYAEAALAAGDRRWGITGVSLRHADARNALAPQDGLYTVLVRDNDLLAAQVVGSLAHVLVAPDEPGAVRAALCLPSVAIVTLTITEKAYGIGADGGLDEHAPDLAHDLQWPQAPRSAVGWLVAALSARRAAGLAPFAVLSCDNLRENGRTLRRLVLDYAQRVFPADAAWLAEEVAFPNSMVDRIVPRTLPQDQADACATHGFADAAPVRCEPFTQWVIEDFAGPRPAWESAGAQIVADVRPFEDAKLRLLNAAHTVLACAGRLLGHNLIAQAAADGDLAAFVRELMREELAPTLERTDQLDPAAYQAQLWPRFANAALGHTTRQVAMDTSAKLAQRHVPALRARQARGEPYERLALVIALWIRYLGAVDEAGNGYQIEDPLRAPLAALAAGWRTDPRATASGVLAVEAVFGDLGGDGSLARAVARHLALIAGAGVRGALRAAR